MGAPLMSQLVIVTGTTGSGKTTTCRELVAAADELWLHFGADLFLGQMVPRKFVDGGPRCEEGVHMAPDDPADPSGPLHLSLGTRGAGLITAMHDMAAAAVRGGQPVVMDHVTTVEPPILQDCVRAFAGLPVLLVALRPPQAILSDRIAGRLAEVEKVLGKEHAARNNEGTRRAGEYIARQIFSHDCFDMTIDTGAVPPSEVACRILERLRSGPAGDALSRIADRFG